jgi:hypothetical protein
MNHDHPLQMLMEGKSHLAMRYISFFLCAYMQLLMAICYPIQSLYVSYDNNLDEAVSDINVDDELNMDLYYDNEGDRVTMSQCSDMDSDPDVDSEGKSFAITARRQIIYIPIRELDQYSPKPTSHAQASCSTCRCRHTPQCGPQYVQ